MSDQTAKERILAKNQIEADRRLSEQMEAAAAIPSAEVGSEQQDEYEIGSRGWFINEEGERETFIRTAQGEMSDDEVNLFRYGLTGRELEEEEEADRKFMEERDKADRFEWKADPSNRELEAEQ